MHVLMGWSLLTLIHHVRSDRSASLLTMIHHISSDELVFLLTMIHQVSSDGLSSVFYINTSFFRM